MKAIIRLLAFFGKETHEVRRQPRLVLSLILGPFLILLIFGLGYMNERPPLRVSLVVPAELQQDERVQSIQRLVDSNFNLVSTYDTPQPALDELAAGKVEMVEVLPPDALKLMEDKQQVPLQLIYNDLDPQKAQYFEYTGYLQVDAINTSLLLGTIGDLQTDMADARRQIAEARGSLQKVNQAMSPEEIADTRRQLKSLDAALVMLSASPAASAALAGQAAQSDQPADLSQAREDIADLDKALAEGQVSAEQQRVQALDGRLARMDQRLGQMEGTSPTTIIAPIKQEYKNLQGSTVDMMIFFAPSVLSLILQHIAVTLGALSLVRERVRGALEFFGVAPISVVQVLLGKYLAYILFLGIIAAALTALLVFGLGVPFLGSIQAFVGFTLLYLVASVGVGFLVSSISRSENQAIQFSMLILLMSIFFSGFILPLEYFRPEVGFISALLPVSHANMGYRNLMLMGHLLQPANVYALAAIALVTFVLVLFIWGRQFRRLA